MSFKYYHKNGTSADIISIIIIIIVVVKVMRFGTITAIFYSSWSFPGKGLFCRPKNLLKSGPELLIL